MVKLGDEADDLVSELAKRGVLGHIDQHLDHVSQQVAGARVCVQPLDLQYMINGHATGPQRLTDLRKLSGQLRQLAIRDPDPCPQLTVAPRYAAIDW